MKKQGKLFVSKKDNLLLKILIIGATLAFLIFLLNVFNSQTKNIFYSFSYPLQKNFWSAGLSSSSFLGSIMSAPSLAAQNASLQQEKEHLLSEIASLKSLQEESNASQSAALVAQNANFELASAGIIGLDADDVISIDKGSINGITEGMPVINADNNLVGKVFRVYNNFSQVMLISHKNSVVNVKVQTQNPDAEAEIDGVVRGAGKLSLYLDLIPIDQQIHQNDVLFTSSLDSSFPKNILVGMITKISKNDQEPHQKAQVQQFFNFTQDTVFVITNYKQID